MADKAEVQQRLFKKIRDKDKVRQLLQSENLLYLLKRYGYQKATLQERIKNGMLPGELLLELLEKEPDPDQLLALLNNNMPVEPPLKVPAARPVSAPMPEPEISAKANPVPTRFNPVTSPASVSNQGTSLFEQPLIRVASVVVTLTAVFPALMYSGFFSNFNIIPSPLIAMIITVIGGAIAGMLLSRTTASAPWKGIMIGILLNVGVLGATIIYSQSRTKLYSVEILLPLVIGSLPAGLLYLILIGRKTF